MTAPASRPSPAVVLVVEDDPRLADAAATLLENSGYSPVITADGTTALGHVRAGDVDLVLLDLDPRPLSGLDLCRQMWATARDAEVHLPILTLTSAARPEDVCASYAAGADDYVPKPFHLAELLARIRVRLQVRALSLVALGPPAPLGPAGGVVRLFEQSAPGEAPDETRLRDDDPRASWATLSGRRVPPVPHREGLLPDLTERLSPREFEVLVLLASRLSNKEIATTLCVSWQTVAKHTNNIYEKLRVPGRRDAVARARTLGVLPADIDLAREA